MSEGDRDHSTDDTGDTDVSDGEAAGGGRLLTALGVVLVLGLVIGFGLIGNAIINSPTEAEETGPPDAIWTLERINDTHVAIRHSGGGPAAASNLTVTVDGATRTVGWSGELVEGDRGVVAAPSGATVRLYWTGGDGREELARWVTE